MSPLIPRASLKRSPRTRTKRSTASHPSDTGCPPSRSSTTTAPDTRPPPLQIIPELPENELDTSPPASPASAQTVSIPPESDSVPSRVTLSEFTFSIDDALLMFSDEPLRSPALSASSSTSESEDISSPPTPCPSDDEEYDPSLPTPRLPPQRISIRPLCITKTRPFADEVTEEGDQDFYAREFQDFISLYSIVPTPSSPARRDSITIAVGLSPTILEAPEPKPQGSSRHSKPLPSLPPVTPPLSTFPSLPTFPLVQTTAQRSIVRRKRNLLALPNYPPPPPPVESRPLPRMAVPEDVDIHDLPEEELEMSPQRIVIEQVYDEDDDASIYSQPSFSGISRRITYPHPCSLPETPTAGMYGDFCIPQSSIDPDTPRSSIESPSSYVSASSKSSHLPISPFSFPCTPRSPSSDDHVSPHPLRSRWSASTLASVAAEQPRSTLLSPLKTVFGARVRRTPTVTRASASSSCIVPGRNPLNLHLRTPSKLPVHKSAFPVTPSPPGTPGRRVRRRGSRASTSSIGSSSECDGHVASSGGLKRKPIPVEMFLRV